MSSYHLPSSPPRRFASRDWTPEATGRTPRMKNQLAASQVGTFPRSYRKDTSNGKPTSLLRESMRFYVCDGETVLLPTENFNNSSDQSVMRSRLEIQSYVLDKST
ncbi:hypothetical protein RRG08_004648 [Elysia crispata]|uniref:Uncharacterized protein n=1 Tax=Elysia crispata TaxID=231223 RepID=A0AAE1DF21_9GAST|nr:hypothetical protein RRG08_004648 [Elysia crispata]